LGSHLSSCSASVCEDVPMSPAGCSSWLLVWCEERCHKPENMSTKQSITEAAGRLGGTTMCMRKAAKLSTWLDRTRRATPPFVLLVSWREVKPCIEVFTTQPNGTRPAYIVVLADTPKVFDKASAWANSVQGLEAEVPVVVAQDFDSMRVLLAVVVAEDLQLGPETQCGLTQRPWPQHAALPVVNTVPKVVNSVPNYFTPSNIAAQCNERFVLSSAVAPFRTPADEAAALAVQRVMSVLAPHNDSERLRILLEAMPDHYED